MTSNIPKTTKPILLFAKYDTTPPVVINRKITGPKQQSIKAIGARNNALGNFSIGLDILVTYKIKNVMTRKVFSMFIVVLVGGLIVAGFVFGGNHKTASLQKTAIASINKPIIPAVFTNLKGQSIALTSYHSKKIMLYLLATWCSSCQASLKTLISNAPTLQKDGLNIVTLETYQDAGYSGPSMQQFIATTTDKPLPTNSFMHS